MYVIRYADDKRTLDLAEFNLDTDENGIVYSVSNAQVIADAIGDAMERFRDFKFVGSFKLRGSIASLAMVMFFLGKSFNNFSWDMLTSWSEYNLYFIETTGE